MQPDDESKRIKERERAVLAVQIFDNPLWDEAYTSLADTLLTDMLRPDIDGEQTLIRKNELLALHSVKRYLATIMETGRMASIQLQEARDGRTR